MTDRLYYNDPHSREFEATVVGVGAREHRAVILLDRSLFYPTSGGQPFDTGTLDALPVVEVFDDEEERVAHVVDGPAGALQVGQRVRGRIDWERRFDHMQQHTGQHVLSAMFERLTSARTVGFHLGSAASTIDLDRPVTALQIAAAEHDANRVVWEDRPVSVRYVTAEEASTLPLRKEPSRAGTLRLVEVEGVDLSACGGTHVVRTGSIGIIAVAAWERFKGGLRVEFVCGERALQRFRALRDASAAAGRLLSVLPGDLAASIERLQSEAKDQKKLVAALQTELATHRAAALAAAAEEGPRGRLIAQAIEGDAQLLKALASELVSRPGVSVALVSRTTPGVVVVARSAGLAWSAQAVVAALIKAFGGRGGGRDDFAQAGGLKGEIEAIVNTARTLIAA